MTDTEIRFLRNYQYPHAHNFISGRGKGMKNDGYDAFLTPQTWSNRDGQGDRSGKTMAPSQPQTERDKLGQRAIAKVVM